jgi:hypothetical protein
MDLVRHSINWVRGEIFEMTIIAITGLALAAVGVAFWRLGSTPLSRAMLTPLAVVGLFFATLGVSGYIANKRRIPAFEQAHREAPAAFARAEKERVEQFQIGYRVTYVVAPVAFAVAAALFWFSLRPYPRAVGIALVIFGLYGFVVDGFSKERADIYYARVIEALATTPSGSGVNP